MFQQRFVDLACHLDSMSLDKQMIHLGSWSVDRFLNGAVPLSCAPATHLGYHNTHVMRKSAC